MHIKAKLGSYEKLQFSMTLTAPVEDWRAALKQIEKTRESGWIAWPLSGLHDSITTMLDNLDKTHVAVLSNDVPPLENP